MSSDNPPTDALARAEEEIKQQVAFLSHLRAKRNFLLPVFRLPPETLEIIFTHGARDYYESYNRGRVTRHIPTWVNVSYVCHHWRNIALNCPTLWIYPFHVSLRWTEELLLRSKQAPLQISYIHPSRITKDNLFSGFLDMFLKHSEHIQELRLCCLSAKLPLRAPHLEKLEIEGQMWDDSVQSIVITDGDKLPLRILKLTNCSLPWHSLNLRGLKTLSLSRVHSPSPLNILQFLTILNDMPSLTLLNLEDILPSARGFLSSGGLGIPSKVDLPHLTHLIIVAPLSAVVAFLYHVNIPLKTRLALELHFEQGCSINDYHPIISSVAQRLSISEERSLSDPIRSLIIDGEFPPILTLSTSEHDYDSRYLTIENWAHDIPLEITLGNGRTRRQDHTDSDKHRIMRDICCSLPSTNVQTLHVFRPEFSSAIWKEILGHLDGLRYMKLSSGRMPNLSFLSHTAHESEENLNGRRTHDQDPTPRHIFVPALEELELVHMKFMDDHEDSMSEKSFFDALSTRKGLRDRLSMIKCKSV